MLKSSSQHFTKHLKIHFLMLKIQNECFVQKSLLQKLYFKYLDYVLSILGKSYHHAMLVSGNMLDKMALLLLYSRFLATKYLRKLFDWFFTPVTRVWDFYFCNNMLLLVTFYPIKQLVPTVIFDSLVCLLISNADIKKHYADKCDLTATYHI